MTTKSNALQALLGASTDIKKNVPIRRLGVDFTLKALTEAEIERVKTECTFGDGKGGKRQDNSLFNAAMIAKACIEPNFADRTLIEHYGAEDAADCVRKALLAGEIVKLVESTLQISGFGDDEIDFPN
ncbi:phage tail assembly chaperone [Paenibacillus sp. LPE1-1-1.1]|uniref:phage tail assembly chaperone n=1 Tax=Paenibacillus sp. LPE1-1-1.1 TaxID=3135230 RepID=UPI00341481B9